MFEIWKLASNPTPADPQSQYCEVFRAQVRRKDGIRRKVHLKVLKPKELACELLVNALAAQMGVPVPEAYITRVEKSQFSLFEQSKRWQRIQREIEANGAEQVAMFASTTLEHPTLDHLLDSDNPSQNILQFIREIAELETAAIFDEWVANPDRHHRNILIADLKTWWLIDHDEAFNSCQWVYKELNHEESFENCLADNLLPNPLPLQVGQEWRKRTTKMAKEARDSNPHQPLSELNKFGFLKPWEVEHLNDFLRKRSQILGGLILRRLDKATQQTSLF